MFFDIIIESIRYLFTNRRKYVRHIVSMVLSIAVIIIMQCIENSTVGQILNTSASTEEEKIMKISIILNDDSDGCDMIPDKLFFEYSDLQSTLKKNGAGIIKSQFLDNGNIICDSGNIYSEIIECTPEYCSNYAGNLIDGRMLNAVDENTGNPAVVISEKTAFLIWGSSHVSGEKISVYTSNYGIIDANVVGIVADDYTSSTQETNEEYISTIYLNCGLFKNFYNEKISELNFLIDNDCNQETLLSGLRNKYDGKFYGTSCKIALTDESIMTDSTEEVMKIMGIIIKLFALLSFFISNLGVMNMRLISVDERTREIGIKKAVGAENSHISLQIISESVVLSLAGTIFGSLSGFAVGTAFSLLMCVLYRDLIETFTVYMPWKATISAVIVTFIISVTFSLFPSYKASKLVIIKAIRSKD